MQHKKVLNGVYVCSDENASKLTTVAKALGAKLINIDGSKFHSKADILRKVGKALHFPDYYGENWDALGDCLHDFSWRKGDSHYIVLSHLDGILHGGMNEIRILGTIFADACKHWEHMGEVFVVILACSDIGLATPLQLPKFPAELTGKSA